MRAQADPQCDRERRRSGRGLSELVHDAAHRREALGRLLHRGPVLEQELVPGIGICVECLYADGILTWHFAHERLHEGTGGGLGRGSFYRKSIAAPPLLLQAAKTLLDALRWHGVAMVELKCDPSTGRFWLMEINPPSVGRSRSRSTRVWISPTACTASRPTPTPAPSRSTSSRTTRGSSRRISSGSADRSDDRDLAVGRAPVVPQTADRTGELGSLRLDRSPAPGDERPRVPP